MAVGVLGGWITIGTGGYGAYGIGEGCVVGLRGRVRICITSYLVI